MKEKASGSIKRADLDKKNIFWDIDGTLAPFRFNGNVSGPMGVSSGFSLESISDGFYAYREPSKLMKLVLSSIKDSRHVVIGHCHYEREIDDKVVWIDTNYPMIDETLFIKYGESKADKILNYCNEHNIELETVVYVDDVIQFLIEAEEKGITSWHISSFLDWSIDET